MLTLTRPWNEVPAGTQLEQLGSAENPELARVDARRYAALLAQGLAVEGDGVPAESTTKKKGAPRG